jgi:hypothetical protein
MGKVSDNANPKLILVEGTTPSNPPAGQQKLFIDSADHKLKRLNSSGTVTTVEGGGSGSFTSFASYTPALTATTTNPSLGTTGALAEGGYCQVGTGSGSLVRGRADIQFGSGMSQGSGSYRISLPVAANTSRTTFTVIGTASVYNGAGGGIKVGVVILVDSTHAQVFIPAGAPNHIIGSGLPGNWAANDSISYDFAYEAA